MEESVMSECVSNEQLLQNSVIKPRKKVREIYRDKILKLSAVYRKESDGESATSDNKLNSINDVAQMDEQSKNPVNRSKHNSSYSICSDNGYTETAGIDSVLNEVKSEVVDIKIENTQWSGNSSQVKNINSRIASGLVSSIRKKSVLSKISKSGGSSISGHLSNHANNETHNTDGYTKVSLSCNSALDSSTDCKPLRKSKEKSQNPVIVADKLGKRGVIVKPVENGPYVCCECSKSFYEPATLRIHVMKHSGYKMYSCAECFKQFTALSTLRSHMRVHTGEMPYKCNICGRRFMFAGNLYKHNTVHNTKPQDHHVCKICGISVKYSANLHHHMRIHTGETRYQCELCNKQFIMRSGYTAHMRVHIGKKEFKCSVCSRLFMDRSALKSHSRTHSGEQPYSCLECPRRFSNTSNLNRHVRSRHSGLKPYECKTCGKRFTNANSVRYHDVLHAREKQEKSQIQLRRKEVKSEIS